MCAERETKQKKSFEPLNFIRYNFSASPKTAVAAVVSNAAAAKEKMRRRKNFSERENFLKIKLISFVLRPIVRHNISIYAQNKNHNFKLR